MRSDEEIIELMLGNRQLKSYPDLCAMGPDILTGLERNRGLAVLLDSKDESIYWFYSQSTYRKKYNRIYYLRKEFDYFDLSDIVQRAACCDWLLEQGDEKTAAKLRKTLKHAWTRQEPNKHQNYILKALRAFFGRRPSNQNLRSSGTLRLTWRNVRIPNAGNQVRDVCNCLGCHYNIKPNTTRSFLGISLSYKVEIIIPEKP